MGFPLIGTAGSPTAKHVLYGGASTTATVTGTAHHDRLAGRHDVRRPAGRRFRGAGVQQRHADGWRLAVRWCSRATAPTSTTRRRVRSSNSGSVRGCERAGLRPRPFHFRAATPAARSPPCGIPLQLRTWPGTCRRFAATHDARASSIMRDYPPIRDRPCARLSGSCCSPPPSAAVLPWRSRARRARECRDDHHLGSRLPRLRAVRRRRRTRTLTCVKQGCAATAIAERARTQRPVTLSVACTPTATQFTWQLLGDDATGCPTPFATSTTSRRFAFGTRRGANCIYRVDAAKRRVHRGFPTSPSTGPTSRRRRRRPAAPSPAHRRRATCPTPAAASALSGACSGGGAVTSGAGRRTATPGRRCRTRPTPCPATPARRR